MCSKANRKSQKLSLLYKMAENLPVVVSSPFKLYKFPSVRSAHALIIDSAQSSYGWRSSYHCMSHIWAASSELVPSSMRKMCGFTPSCTCSKSHPEIQYSSPLMQYPMILFADSEGPNQTARMRRLIWAFAVCICHKTRFRMERPYIYLTLNTPWANSADDKLMTVYYYYYHYNYYSQKIKV